MNIFEAYNMTLTEEQIDFAFERYRYLNEEVFTAALIAALTTGVFLKMLDKHKSNHASVIDWLAGFIKWGMEEYDGNIDIRDIKKYAYEYYETDDEEDELTESFGSKDSKILQVLKKAKTKTAAVYSKTVGKLVGRLAKRSGLSKSELDKVINKAS